MLSGYTEISHSRCFPKWVFEKEKEEEEDINDKDSLDEVTDILPSGEPRITRMSIFWRTNKKITKEFLHPLESYSFFLWTAMTSFLSEICALFSLWVAPWLGCPW